MTARIPARVTALILSALLMAACQAAAPSSAPVTRTTTPADLDRIIVSAATIPSGWTIDRSFEAPAEILVYPARSEIGTVRATGLVDTLVAGRGVEGSAAPDGIYVAWTALFDDVAAAERALAIYQDDFVASAAWSLDAVPETALGDSGVRFIGDTTRLIAGSQGEPVSARIYLWRVDSLLLAVGGFFDADPEALRSIATAMDERAR